MRVTKPAHRRKNESSIRRRVDCSLCPLHALTDEQLLSLLAPTYAPDGAHLLGWHVEGPFLQDAKRGAHESNFLLAASEGFKTFEDVYGADNLQLGFERDDGSDSFGVKCITAAPEVEGVLDTVEELVKRGVVFSIGHRFVTLTPATSLMFLPLAPPTLPQQRGL